MAHAGLTADRIIEEAAKLADVAGFDKVTMSAVARRLRVADASLYSHVKDLQNLRVRLAIRAARDLADCIMPEVVGRSGRDALAAFADAYRAFALTYPGRYAATQIPLGVDDFAKSDGHLRLTELTYSVLRGYGLEEPDLTDATRLLRSAFHGFVNLEAAGSFGHPRDLAASWERIVVAVDRTLQYWPSTTAARSAPQSTEGISGV